LFFIATPIAMAADSKRFYGMFGVKADGPSINDPNN
jgi:hypothetical protein